MHDQPPDVPLPHRADRGLRLTANPTDEDIEAPLRAAPDAAWAELARALRDVEADPRYATWRGGEGVPAQQPYPVYSEPVERLLRALTGVRAFVVFDWMHWDGLDRYRTASDVATASAADAVRLVTAIIRSERFGDGSILAALGNGLLQAAAHRLLAWH